MDADAGLRARRTARVLEPLHSFIYFSKRATAAYTEAGLESFTMGYFASRSAALGAPGAGTVVATFFNFAPELVSSVIPRAWTLCPPEGVLAARYRAAEDELAAALGAAGPDPQGPAVHEAADLVQRAAAHARAPGRPLYAAQAELDPPHGVLGRLWHYVTLLREYRGDAHVAALTLAGLDGCEALVLHAGVGGARAEGLQRSRGWSDEAWAGARARLADRGLLDEAGMATDAGRAFREEIERQTDEAARAPYDALGPAGCARLAEGVAPMVAALGAAGTLPAFLTAKAPT